MAEYAEDDRVVVILRGSADGERRRSGTVKEAHPMAVGDEVEYVVDLDASGEAHVTAHALIPIDDVVDGREHVPIGKIEALLEDVQRWAGEPDPNVEAARAALGRDAPHLHADREAREAVYGKLADEIRERFPTVDEAIRRAEADGR